MYFNFDAMRWHVCTFNLYLFASILYYGSHAWYGWTKDFEPFSIAAVVGALINVLAQYMLMRIFW